MNGVFWRAAGLGAVCVFGSLNAALASENLLSNPGFENGYGAQAPGWSRQTFGTPGGSLEVVCDPAQAHSGKKCIKIDPPKGYTTLMQGWGAPWDPGVYPGKRQQYLVKAYARGANSVLLMHLAIYSDTVDAGGSLSTNDDAQAIDVKNYRSEYLFPVSGEWKEYAVLVTVPKGVSYLNVMFGAAAGSKGPLFIDDVGLYDAREAEMRYLPSKDRLVASVDPTYLRHKLKLDPSVPLSVELEVFAKGNEAALPAARGSYALGSGRNVLRLSTAALPEGEYTTRATIRNQAGQSLGSEDDWFDKRVFEWMRNPRGVGEDVPRPYTALVAAGREVRPWGRTYRFNEQGLLDAVTSQGAEWLNRAMELTGAVGGQPAAWKITEPFAFTSAKPGEVCGRARLQSGNLAVSLESVTQYDGLVRFRMTYGPVQGSVTINRLRLRAPLAGSRCLFYSADGAERHWAPENKDPEGGYAHDLLPARQGKVFDSLERPQRGGLPLTFTGLFWLADHDTCFCYAADNDDGWLIRDDAPSVEAIREGEDLVLWLNLVDREDVLTGPRTLEFAFQAGPTKPLPEGWRGIQCGGNTNDAPVTFSLMPQAGSGYTLNGATHFIHPGTTQELRRRSRDRVQEQLAGGRKAVGGYNFWGTVPKGFPETRVFRSEWGVDKYKWASLTKPRDWEWKNRFFGDNADLCIILPVKVVPSYVEFITYAYDEALKETALSGFYDDCGYPREVFDEELGLGYTRDDGQRVCSSGLWIYRERWKRAAYINSRHDRPNYLWDSQHVHAHYLPAYNFIGIWAPCEHGYYNSLKDPQKDSLDFYGSIERYVAFNPSRQFGQIPMIGMSAEFRENDPALFARHTRTMMMLAFLNDQDVGSFGKRDMRVVCELRRARNGFRPWEQDTRFVGYWQNQGWLSGDRTNVLTSLYYRPDGALLVLGNTGPETATVTVEPLWQKLELDPAKLTAVNAETGAVVALTAGASRRGFTVQVPRHDLRLVLVGPPGRYLMPLGADRVEGTRP